MEKEKIYVVVATYHNIGRKLTEMVTTDIKKIKDKVQELLNENDDDFESGSLEVDIEIWENGAYIKNLDFTARQKISYDIEWEGID